MYIRTEVVAVILVAVALLVVFLVVLLRRYSSPRALVASDFNFSSPKDTQRQQFVYEVAGLIKVATGLETYTSGLGNYPYLDIEVHRGQRCVGIVSVMPDGDTASAIARIQALVRIRADKRTRTAYLVSAGLFDVFTQRRARKAGVTLLDGAALSQIRLKAEAGGYVKKPEPPRELTPAEAKRWRRPMSASPASVQPAADSVESPKHRRFRLPPWVEYR